jgi:hypothetical protein
MPGPPRWTEPSLDIKPIKTRGIPDPLPEQKS